jgi:hypothetical protein
MKRLPVIVDIDAPGMERPAWSLSMMPSVGSFNGNV